jgi:RND family efflux transporter MFP subunit
MKTEETERPEAKVSESTNGPKPVWRAIGTTAFIVAAFAALGLVINSGITARAAAAAQLVQATTEAAVPSVNVVHPKTGAPTQEIVLPGNMQAFTDSPIYARTSGYLSKWYFDIGSRVTQGQLLAEIETPEIDQQLQQARAQLETAQANYHLAETTAERWKFLLETNSVSKQETDQAIGNLAAQKANADSSAANVRRLEQLQSFEKVYAPFDGVIIVRNTDVGALIDAGAGTPAKELFHLAAIHTLRVFVPVPEAYARAAVSGANVSLTLDEFPGDVFHGTLVRNSNSIDTASRTLLVEVDVENPTGQLLPGAYVSVHLNLPDPTRSVTIPANTLLFRSEGLRVGVVRNGRAELTPVKIGRDYGGAVEVLSGLRPSDSIILDPADSLISGTPVRLVAGKSPGGGR